MIFTFAVGQHILFFRLQNVYIPIYDEIYCQCYNNHTLSIFLNFCQSKFAILDICNLYSDVHNHISFLFSYSKNWSTNECICENQTTEKQEMFAKKPMPPSLGNTHKDIERKLQIIIIFLSHRGITLSKIAQSYPILNWT